MAKSEWGVKRVCQSCDVRFYDLRRDPIVCPSCGTKFDPESVLRSRRNRAGTTASAVAAKKAEVKPKAKAEVEADAESEDVVAEDDFEVPDGPNDGDEEDA